MKSERFEIKLEDNQLDKKHSIDEMMASFFLLYFVPTIDRFQENYDALERKKEELKQLLAVKMEVCHLARDNFQILLNCISFRHEKGRSKN